jgi:hypothetical protein
MRVTLFALLLSAFAPQIAAAEDCYQEIEVAETDMNCDPNKTNSADFTNGCNYTGQKKIVKVPVECGKMWMNAPAHWSRSQYMYGDICGFYQMENADFNGVICASATLQPQSGLGYEAINDHQWKSRPQGMGSYKIIYEGGTHILPTSLSSGRVCSNRPTWPQWEAQGAPAEYLTARVCKESGKVN